MMGTGTELVPVLGISHIFGGIRIHTGKIWYQKKFSEPVLVKIGAGKVSGSVSENFGTKKKVLVLVSDYLVPKKYRYWYRLKFWVPSHSGQHPSLLRHPMLFYMQIPLLFLPKHSNLTNKTLM